jgi:hypothetical protein
MDVKKWGFFWLDKKMDVKNGVFWLDKKMDVKNRGFFGFLPFVRNPVFVHGKSVV